MVIRSSSNRLEQRRSANRAGRAAGCRRRRFAPWIVALFLLQPILGSSFFQSAFALLLHGDDHTHRLVLVPDEGHFDVLLAHAGESVSGDPGEEHGIAGEQDRSPAERSRDHSIVPASSERDHVSHWTVSSEDATLRDSIRPPPPANAALAWASPPASTPARSPSISGAGRHGIAVRPPPTAPSARALRTIVLRI